MIDAYLVFHALAFLNPVVQLEWNQSGILPPWLPMLKGEGFVCWGALCSHSGRLVGVAGTSMREGSEEERKQWLI